MTYVGRYRATPGLVACGLLGVLVLGYPAVLSLFPEAYDAFFRDGRTSALSHVPRPLMGMACSGMAVWLALALVSAVGTGRAVVILDDGGVTCFRIRGPGRHLLWSEVTRVAKRGLLLRFFGGLSGQQLLGECSLLGQDLGAIRAVIKHHRPDLAQVLP